MKTESIVYGTIILIVTNTLVKIMSLIYRGITIRLIGAEGLGLTEMMMPLYSLLIVISSLGIPLAISNMISAEGSDDKIRSIVKTGTILLILSSVTIVFITGLALPFFGDFIFTDTRIIPGFFVLIPSVFLISLFSVLRAYFQGTHQSSLIGKSQVVEQTTRMVAGILILTFFVQHQASLSLILMGVAAASFLAETGGGIYLWRKYSKQCTRNRSHFQKKMAKNMLRNGAPITLSRLVISATTAVQAIIVPMALTSHGASQMEAASFFGLFAGVALTILHLPSIVTGALITPLIPAIAEANSRKDHLIRNIRIAKSIKFTNLTSLPILSLLFYFAKEICALLFASPEAGPMLSMLCLGAIFLYLQQPIIGILQGMNKFYRIFIHYCIADFIYLASLVYLQLTASFSTEIFIFLFIINDVLIFIMNYFYLKKITGFKINVLKTYLAPVIALGAGFIIMVSFEKHIMQTNITNFISMTLSACLFLLCYIFTLFISGALDRDTISSLLSLHKHR